MTITIIIKREELVALVLQRIEEIKRRRDEA